MEEISENRSEAYTISPQPSDGPQIPAKMWLVLGLVIFMVIGGSIYFLSQNKQASPSSPVINPLTQKQPSPALTAEITISSKGFVPQTLKITKGTQVTWTNNDTRPHQIMTDPHPLHSLLPQLKGEGPVNKGSSYSYVFNNKGTFTYHDEITPLKFKGTIIVE